MRHRITWGSEMTGALVDALAKIALAQKARKRWVKIEPANQRVANCLEHLGFICRKVEEKDLLVVRWDK